MTLPKTLLPQQLPIMAEEGRVAGGVMDASIASSEELIKVVLIHKIMICQSF